MTRKSRFFAPALAALLFAATQAGATLSQAISMDEKVERAESIVLGKCVKQQSQWDAAHRHILTYSTFQVEKVMKGAPAQEITIVTPGGTVGTVAQDVVGVPRFEEGNEQIVFVRNTRSGPTVLYFDQGAYDVVSEGRERMVRPRVSDAVVMDLQRGVAVAPEAPRRLRDFETGVRDTMRRQKIAQMEMVMKAKREEASVGAVLRRNWLLVAVALIGGILATWQLMKRW
jgi:hypothetical protein